MNTFEPDLFSKSTPHWIEVSTILKDKLEPLISQLIPKINLSDLLIEQSDSIEINSSNFRISFLNKKYILKKWPLTKNFSSLVKIQKTILFLKDKNIPVPKIISFLHGKTILKWNYNYWTCSEFIGGDYFSGEKNQLENAAILTAKTSNYLLNLPSEIQPSRQIIYDLDEIKNVFNKIHQLRVNWVDIFGYDNSVLLLKQWGMIIQTFKHLKKAKIIQGQLFSNHYDMHPHNILFFENDPICLLDFDSIVKIPVGFSIAYSSLKQCRQTIAYNQAFGATSNTGKSYIDSLRTNLKIGDDRWLENFKELAQIETLRRLGVIFKLNLKGNQVWNKVLPILVSHLYEAEELFE